MELIINNNNQEHIFNIDNLKIKDISKRCLTIFPYFNILPYESNHLGISTGGLDGKNMIIIFAVTDLLEDDGTGYHEWHIMFNIPLLKEKNIDIEIKGTEKQYNTHTLNNALRMSESFMDIDEWRIYPLENQPWLDLEYCTP